VDTRPAGLRCLRRLNKRLIPRIVADAAIFDSKPLMRFSWNFLKIVMSPVKRDAACCSSWALTRRLTTQMVAAREQRHHGDHRQQDFHLELVRLLNEKEFMTQSFGSPLCPCVKSMRTSPVFRHDDFAALAGQPLMPGLDFVRARRDIADDVSAIFFRGGEIGIFQDQHHNNSCWSGWNRKRPRGPEC